jgi:ABC-type transporter Mla MlaB component
MAIPWPLRQEGRKGIMILAPIFRKHREADAEQDATDDSRALVGYHPVFVFDESQTARRRYCSDWNRQRRSGFKPMLRITETDVAVDGAKLRLDGKLAGPWVCELKLRCEPILAKSERIQMDCGGVSSVDSDGIALMQILQAKGVTLVNCSLFIKLQLGQR